MYAILGALQSGEFPFQFSTNGRFVDMGDFRDVVFGHDTSKRILIGMTLDGDLAETKISSSWAIDPNNQLPELDELIVKHRNVEMNGKAISITSAAFVNAWESRESIGSIKKEHRKENGDILIEFTFLFGQVEDILEKISKSKNNAWDGLRQHLLKQPESGDQVFKALLNDSQNEVTVNDVILGSYFFDIHEQVSQEIKKINYIGSFRLPPSRTYLEQNRSNITINHLGEGYLEQIIQWELRDKAKYAQLVQTMKDLELLNSIRTKRMEGGRYEMAVRVKEDGVETSLTDIGFGVSQFLPIIVADLQLPNGSTLFVSQPETHLHPSVQSSFGAYLVRQANTLDKNYIIETHSEYLLNRIRLAIVKGEIKEEDVSVYYLEPHPDGNISHRVTFDRQGRILGAPEDFFKTYMMDVMEIAMQAE
jgi:predicted ATP-dependent endonuclease of OLD family